MEAEGLAYVVHSRAAIAPAKILQRLLQRRGFNVLSSSGALQSEALRGRPVAEANIILFLQNGMLADDDFANDVDYLLMTKHAPPLLVHENEARRATCFRFDWPNQVSMMTSSKVTAFKLADYLSDVESIPFERRNFFQKTSEYRCPSDLSHRAHLRPSHLACTQW